jgi:hypothetical protein
VGRVAVIYVVWFLIKLLHHLQPCQEWQDESARIPTEARVKPVHTFVKSVVLVLLPSAPKSTLGKMEGRNPSSGSEV